MDTLSIPITQKHIDNGQKGNSMFCAFALALIDATGEVCSSGRTTCRVGGRAYYLSPSAAQFVKDFDTGVSLPTVVIVTSFLSDYNCRRLSTN